MRIAILSNYFFYEVKEVHGRDRIIFGGAERYLVELHKFLVSEGHEVFIYQPLDNSTRDADGRVTHVNCGNLVKDYLGMPIICVPNHSETWSHGTNSRLNLTFNEASSRFDLRVYFATFLCWPQVVLPAISISHGVFWDFPYHEVRTRSEDDRREFFRRNLYGFTAPDACVAVDSNVKKVLAALEPGSENRIHLINNFVDTSVYQPAPRTWSEVRVLYSRRLDYARGLNDFIKASEELPQHQFLAVGQAAQEEWERAIAAWGSTRGNLRFIHRPMDQMVDIYQQVDISVLPTRGAEGLSLSLLESMACGLPIITTPVGGLGDAVIDGYNALIYDPNHHRLEEYVQVLAEDPDLRLKFGERNRRIAVECFDLQFWRNKWRKLLAQF